MIKDLPNFYHKVGYSRKTHYNYLELFKEDLPKSGKILDVGCADGRLLLILKELGFEAVGLELAQSLVDRARVYSGCNVFYGTAEEMIMFKDREFDCVICTEVLEHVPNPSKALLEIYRVLKSNGTAIISSPNAHHLVRLMRPLHFIRSEIINRHLNVYDLTQWEALFLMSGFKVIWFKGYPDNWIFPRLKGIGKILDKIFRNKDRFKRQLFFNIKKVGYKRK